jgi:hypothetical protein
VLLLAMFGVACYAWITLPADARVPVHFGAGYNNFVSKRVGLITHAAAGVLVYVLLAVQIGAIKVARTKSGTAG